MQPKILFLCAKCKTEFESGLHLTRLVHSDNKKQPCQNCGQKCYGELYMAKDKPNAKL